MDRLGPWDGERRVAVAVSGGADSLALAVLAQGWGDCTALIVDHGLRETSAAEAEAARITLAARGMATRVLKLEGLSPGPAIAARARSARYAALGGACRNLGLVDLLLGHHAGDQAETVLMRQRRGSGLAGLAGMAALVETDDIRLLRPLLGIDPARLRVVVAGAGLVPVEDPTNTDMRSTRARLRREIGLDRQGLLAIAAQAGGARAAAEHAVAGELARRVALRPEGFAILSPGPIGEAALAAVLRSVSGRRFPVRKAGALAAHPRAATLAGARLLPAGRLGAGWLIVREKAAIQTPVAAEAGTVWDRRFRVATALPGAEIGLDLGGSPKRHGLPASVRQTLPCLRGNSPLSPAEHLLYGPAIRADAGGVLRPAGLPAAGAPFVAGS